MVTPLRILDKLRIADSVSQYLHNSNRIDKEQARDHSPSQWAIVPYEPSVFDEVREKLSKQDDSSRMEIET